MYADADACRLISLFQARLAIFAFLLAWFLRVGVDRNWNIIALTYRFRDIVTRTLNLWPTRKEITFFTRRIERAFCTQ